MLESIIDTLRARTDVQAWSVRHITTHSTQLYTVRSGVEAKRAVTDEQYAINILRHTSTAQGETTCGTSHITVLPGDDLAGAIDRAVMMASLVHNPLHSIPAPSALPDVPLADAELQANPSARLDELYGRLSAAVAKHAHVRMTAAELFGAEETIHLINSRGVDATQVATEVAIEWVLISRSGEGAQARQVESFVEMTRRRAAGLDIEGEVDRRAQYALDLLKAVDPPNHTGAVVLRGAVLANFFGGATLVADRSVFHLLGSGEAKYNNLSTWEIGQSVFRREVTADPLTLWANRQLPYGSYSSCFDDEGLPAQRVALIQDNRLTAFTASQRYADYLSVAPTGSFGNVEVAPGTQPAAALLSEPHVEIAAFSWFNPSPVTGDFACEIRLGYIVDNGQRTPFRGGLLVGNVLDALADVRYSAETGFYGDYFGPTMARFGQLTVADAK